MSSPLRSHAYPTGMAVLDLASLPRPAGFGSCGACAYAGLGSAAICFGCATQTVERPTWPRRCTVCELELDGRGSCANPVCAWPHRSFHSVRAVFMHSERLRWALHRYKAIGHRAWAEIFGRILVGYLREHQRDLAPPDLLLPSPTYVGPGGRTWDHVGLIVEHASAELGSDWPVARRVIVKDRPTRALKFCASWRERLDVAREQIRPSLRVPEPKAVAGRRVLVFDDVFTEGLTLHEVARTLRLAGAREVGGIVLARQPFAPTASPGPRSAPPRAAAGQPAGPPAEPRVISGHA
jgi:predicted amidophosphoribosyltransferase